jgi:mRNA interferase MazF
MAYDQGDVVLVNFPFTDLTSTKKRPALVVSARWFNEQSEGDCILAATPR